MKKALFFPKTFTYPFYYQPDEFSQTSCFRFTKRIEAQDWEHNFGLIPNQKGLAIGKCLVF